jgi:uncharacterized protein YebE (UPF0316 family)
MEEKIALVHRLVRIINANVEVDLAGGLRSRDYRLTRVEGHGRDGPVQIMFMVVKRRDLGRLLAVIDELAPRAFVGVERVDRAHGEVFAAERAVGRRAGGRFGGIRK